MKIRVSRWSLLALLALLVPLAVLGWLRAQESDRAATPPTSVAVPAESQKPAEATPEPGSDDEEELLPPGEQLSADNNLSWPVDI